MKSFRIHLISEDIKAKLRRLKKLSSSEKKELLLFFSSNPHLEGSKGGIDWNNKNLTYNDFNDVLQKISRRKIKTNVKKHGLKGLRENKDYIDVSYMFDYYNAYVPLNYEASQMFGSKYIGKCEGKWCTSGNRPATWNDYTTKGVVIIIIMSPDGNKKYAIATHDKLMDVEIYDEHNKEVNSVPNENVVSVVRSNKADLVKLNRKIKQYEYNSVEWVERAETDDAHYDKSGRDSIIWHDGVWIKGSWYKGTWENGIWLDGTWREGIWKDGTWQRGKWEYGKWEDGTWVRGTWVSGDHHDGIWEGGDWLYGIWWDGEWKGGTWHGGAWVDGEWNGGKWKGGYDQMRNWHPEDDSPDKW